MKVSSVIIILLLILNSYYSQKEPIKIYSTLEFNTIGDKRFSNDDKKKYINLFNTEKEKISALLNNEEKGVILDTIQILYLYNVELDEITLILSYVIKSKKTECKICFSKDGKLFYWKQILIPVINYRLDFESIDIEVP